MVPPQVDSPKYSPDKVWNCCQRCKLQVATFISVNLACIPKSYRSENSNISSFSTFSDTTGRKGPKYFGLICILADMYFDKEFVSHLYCQTNYITSPPLQNCERVKWKVGLRNGSCGPVYPVLLVFLDRCQMETSRSLCLRQRV